MYNVKNMSRMQREEHGRTDLACPSAGRTVSLQHITSLVTPSVFLGVWGMDLDVG